MSLETYGWLVLAFPLGGAILLALGFKVLPGRAAGVIGTLFLTKFLIAFEVASLLLLVAAVGAVILARRRSGLELENEISDAGMLRGDTPALGSERGEGTMLEAAGKPGR